MVTPFLDLRNRAAIFHHGSAIIRLLLACICYIESLITHIFTIALFILYQFWNFLYGRKPHSFLHYLADFHLYRTMKNSLKIWYTNVLLPQTAPFFELENGVAFFHQGSAVICRLLTGIWYIEILITRRFTIPLLVLQRFRNVLYGHKLNSVLHYLADFYLYLAAMNRWTCYWFYFQ